MTAEQWEACDDPVVMLDAVIGLASQRRLRQFACGCCRRVWPLAAESRLPWGRPVLHAIEAAEAFADGRQDETGLWYSWHAISSIRRHATEFTWDQSLVRTLTKPRLWVGGLRAILEGAQRAVASAADDRAVAQTASAGREVQVAREAWRRRQATLAEERVAQADLLRCVFGNPFCPPVAISPAVLARNGGAAVTLASALYSTLDPARVELDAVRLATLADVLEEAGVDDRAALRHLRGPGPHCRGCHVVDTVLGWS